jgi:hypothetical protein
VGNENWEWRYSALTGVMYGPVPVGIIAVAVIAGVYFLTQQH